MENLRRLREKRNINQLKLAMDIGITQESISKYENDSAFPSKKILIKIADYFNCSTDYLLDRTDIVNMNTEKNLHNKDEEIENLIFRFNHLSNENKKRLEGCLLILEQDNKF